MTTDNLQSSINEVRMTPMSDLARRLDRLHSEEARSLGQMLYSMSIVVEDFSADDDNPNVSAWLRGGAIDSLLKIQEELAELYY
jgi:hypothetical protein